MKYEESYGALRADVIDQIKKLVPEAFTEKLLAGGVGFEFPQDRELELKVKYDIDEVGGSCTLKVIWENEIAEEDEDEEDDEDKDKEED